MPIGAIIVVAAWFFITSADPVTVKIVGWGAFGLFVLFCIWVCIGDPTGGNSHHGNPNNDNDHADFKFRQDRERRDAILRMRDKDRDANGWY